MFIEQKKQWDILKSVDENKNLSYSGPLKVVIPPSPQGQAFILSPDNNACPKSSPVWDSGTKNFKVPYPTHLLDNNGFSWEGTPCNILPKHKTFSNQILGLVIPPSEQCDYLVIALPFVDFFSSFLRIFLPKLHMMYMNQKPIFWAGHFVN